MINRQILKHKLDLLSDEEVAEVLEYISIMEAVRAQVSSPDPLEEALLGFLIQSMRYDSSFSLGSLQPRGLAN